MHTTIIQTAHTTKHKQQSYIKHTQIIHKPYKHHTQIIQNTYTHHTHNLDKTYKHPTHIIYNKIPCKRNTFQNYHKNNYIQTARKSHKQQTHVLYNTYTKQTTTHTPKK